MKTLFSALAVVMLLGATTAAPARADCWAGPGGWHCWHPHWHHWHHHWGWDHRW